MPSRDLIDALHALHHEAGWPSLRSLAREAGCSHTTVAAVFSSPRLPSWGVLELVVEAMGGDVGEFRRLWLAASGPATVPGSRIAGRRSELAAVRRHLGSGTGLLLVTGEAGIGKTRLVDTAAGLVAGSASSIFVARGACRPLSTQVPLLPVTDVLRSVYRVDDGQWLKEGLAECPMYVRASLRRLLPELDEPGTAAVPDDDWWRQQLFSAVDTTLAALADVAAARGARRGPALGRRNDPGPARAPAEHRPGAAPGRHLPPRRSDRARNGPGLACAGPPAGGGGRARAGSADPRRHGRAAGPAGREVQPDPAWVDRIYRRAAGQPLFTEQLVAQAGDDQPLPDVLADLLDRRLDGLAGPAWSVARALGIADRPLTHLELRDVTTLTTDGLTTQLRDLDRRRLLAASTAGTYVSSCDTRCSPRRCDAGSSPVRHPTCTVASPPCWPSHATRLRPRSPTTGPARRTPSRSSSGGSGPRERRQTDSRPHRRPTSGSGSWSSGPTVPIPAPRASSRSRSTWPAWTRSPCRCASNGPTSSSTRRWRCSTRCPRRSSPNCIDGQVTTRPSRGQRRRLVPRDSCCRDL